MLFFSNTDYHFTAPVRGLYWFSVSMLTSDSGRVDLTVNDLARVMTEEQSRYGGSSTSAILMLETGDRVSCRKGTSGHNLYEQYSYPPSYNTFAGFLYAEF